MTASRLFWRNGTRCLAVLVALLFATTQGCSTEKPSVDLRCPEATLTTTDAAGSVRLVLEGLHQHRLDVLLEFLPPSMQSDVEKLTHEFGERLDEKSWKPFVVTCRKAHRVVSQIIQPIGRISDTMEPADRELLERFRDIEALLNELVHSDLSEVARFRRLDVAKLLEQLSGVFQASAALRKLDGDPFAAFGDVKVELLESSGDTSLLRVQWPGQEPTQHTFVRVEEHWIPQTLAEAWPTEFPRVREQVLAWADELRSNPEPWHARLREIDQLLDELAATKSLTETRQVGQAGLSRLAVAWFGVTIPEPPKTEEIPVESAPPSKPVRIKRPDTEVLLPDEPQK